MVSRDRREHGEVGGMVWGIVERRHSALWLLFCNAPLILPWRKVKYNVWGPTDGRVLLFLSF